ncbi:HNH endonuclease [Streptomyces sp. DSM 41972]|uniref:HNH endonuclease n=1 Tax=Streptomyces althioticus subsp. attaecolombicae TaxID=3075534 RepID=A0ABU3I703_9ACTN|nr:HNH endonuclease [Streptomyces sp. DSM 41972]SCD88743.1 HNH endonuclease [Streptomyces sp. di50b]SCE55416.1 HNH endonuclease [Streptomyces sp. di188]
MESPNPSTFQVRLSARYASDADLIEDLARVAATLGKTDLTHKEYEAHGNYNPSTIRRRFGSWTEALRQAGLRSGRPDLGHSDADWMANILDVWTAKGHQPSYGDMRGSCFSPEGYAKRFGSWGSALLCFQQWVQAEGETGLPTEPRTQGRTSKAPGLRLRWKLLQRAGFKCESCGRSPATEPGVILHIDHILPYSKGGETIEENLQVLCEACNLGKSDT